MRRTSNHPSLIELSEKDWPEHDQSGFVVLDFETTGLDPLADRVIEIGLIRLDSEGKPVAAWNSLVNPEGPVGATEIHGIAEEDLVDAPTFLQLADEFFSRIRHQVLVAHNYSFDGQFLGIELGRAGWSIPGNAATVCTLQHARRLIPGLSRYRLSDCAMAIGMLPENSHQALDDAHVASKLLQYFLGLKGSSADQLRNAPVHAAGADWVVERGEPQFLEVRERSSVGRGFRKTKNTDTKFQNLFTMGKIGVSDVIDADAPEAEFAYVEMFLDYFGDLHISSDEIASLDSLAKLSGLDDWRVRELRIAIFETAVEFAWHDGRVSRNEKKEIDELASLLAIDVSDANEVVQVVERKRKDELSKKVKELPADWNAGEPLRVGDAVVFTGCEDSGRDQMEDASRSAGLRVTGSVSGKTKVLVSDGSMQGTKLAKAKQLGVRIVDPKQFWTLLEYIQPAE